jgi:hypothetical protein
VSIVRVALVETVVLMNECGAVFLRRAMTTIYPNDARTMMLLNRAMMATGPNHAPERLVSPHPPRMMYQN